MNDDDWGAISQRLSYAWPQQLNPESLEGYRTTLADLGAIGVMAAVDGFIRDNRDTVPPPAAIRARTLELVAPAPAASAPPGTPTSPPLPASTIEDISAPAVPALPAPTFADALAANVATTPGISVKPPPSGATYRVRIRKSPIVYAAGIAPAVVLISCFMPWVSAPLLSISGSATEDGKLVMALAAAGVGALWLSTARMAFTWVSAILGILSGVVMAVDLNNIQSRVAESGLDGFASPGIGIYIGLIASVVWVIAAALSGMETRTPQSAASGR